MQTVPTQRETCRQRERAMSDMEDRLEHFRFSCKKRWRKYFSARRLIEVDFTSAGDQSRGARSNQECGAQPLSMRNIGACQRSPEAVLSSLTKKQGRCTSACKFISDWLS